MEVGGGSIRIHDADQQEKILRDVLKVRDERIQSLDKAAIDGLQVDATQFDHLLRSLRSGCPPHGGIALGLKTGFDRLFNHVSSLSLSLSKGFDRLMAVIVEAASLRDVVAFPKSFNGRDLLTKSPSTL